MRSGIALIDFSSFSKDATFHSGPSSSLGRSAAGETGLIQSSELSSRDGRPLMLGWQLGRSGRTGRGGGDDLAWKGPSSTVDVFLLRRQQQNIMIALRMTATGMTTEIAMIPAFLCEGLEESERGSEEAL